MELRRFFYGRVGRRKTRARPRPAISLPLSRRTAARADRIPICAAGHLLTSVYRIHHFLELTIAQLQFQRPDLPDRRGYGAPPLGISPIRLPFPNVSIKVRENGAEILYFPSSKKAGGRLRRCGRRRIIVLTNVPADIDCTAAVILDQLHNSPHNIVVLSSIFQRRGRYFRR